MAEIIQDSHQFLVNTTLVAQWQDTLPYPTTRKIYRHESNEGSVIEFDLLAEQKDAAVGLTHTQLSTKNFLSSYYNKTLTF